jgi:hypothetical protein
LGAVLNSDTKENDDEITKSIEADRRIIIEASIVRVMKSRKELSHLDLVQQIIIQCKSRFNPEISMIKKCIEQMIEKQYIDRVEQSIYRYIQ